MPINDQLDLDAIQTLDLLALMDDRAAATVSGHLAALVAEVRRLRARVAELEGEQQPQCGRTRSVNGDDFPPCVLRAGHKTAYCQSSDRRTYFIAAADQPPAARSAAV